MRALLPKKKAAAGSCLPAEPPGDFHTFNQVACEERAAFFTLPAEIGPPRELHGPGRRPPRARCWRCQFASCPICTRSVQTIQHAGRNAALFPEVGLEARGFLKITISLPGAAGAGRGGGVEIGRGPSRLAALRRGPPGMVQRGILSAIPKREYGFRLRRAQSGREARRVRSLRKSRSRRGGQAPP